MVSPTTPTTMTAGAGGWPTSARRDCERVTWEEAVRCRRARSRARRRSRSTPVASACVLRVLRATTIGSVVTTLTASGIATPSTLPDDSASLTYTMAASASPSSTFDNVAFTFASRDFGVTLTLALASTWSANLPHGTDASQSTTTIPRPGQVGQRPRCSSGCPSRVTITSLFLAKFAGSSALSVRRDDLVHVRLVGRGEHVRGRALLDLRLELRRRPEAEHDFRARVRGLELLAQRR